MGTSVIWESLWFKPKAKKIFLLLNFNSPMVQSMSSVFKHIWLLGKQPYTKAVYSQDLHVPLTIRTIIWNKLGPLRLVCSAWPEPRLASQDLYQGR